MKTNELRIGNLVQYNLSSGAFDDDTEQIPLKIITIGAEDWAHNYVRLDDGFNNSYDFDEIIPIHLTEEWLIKIGFEKWAMYYTLNQVEVVKFSDNMFHSTIRGDLMIEYVHQLQNLYFALTGEELSIKE